MPIRDRPALIVHTSYKYSKERKSYRGICLSDSEFKEYLSTRVNERFYDAKGTQDLLNSFDKVKQTEFDSENLKSMFESKEIPRDWKIGEKISECFLEDYCDVIFPYNDNRDAKDSRSNLPGTDMVGFVKINDRHLFLFGEVKTSDQDRNPPSIVYGSDGLIKQLNEIRDDSKKRMELIRWLRFKVGSHDNDKEMWIKAASNYLNTGEFKIFGVMIRGVMPNKRDLESVFRKIVRRMKDEIYLELLSLYLPILKSQYAEVMGKQH